MFLGDFHTHSTFSDGRLSVRELVDLYGQNGIKCLAITDHICETHTFLGRAAQFLNRTLTKDSFSLYQKVIAAEALRAREQYGMLLIPGFEITKNAISPHDAAHIVCLGVRDWVDPNQSVAAVIDQVHASGGIVIAAHPVSTRKAEPQTFYLWNHRDRLASKLDAWEVASGTVLFEEVLESGLPIIASSDLHHPQQLRSWKTKFFCDLSEAAVLSAICRQELELSFFSIQAATPRLLSVQSAAAAEKLLQSS